MLVDYVIVAYRSAPDLPECLDSIVDDAPARARIIVVDNASPDGSGDIARAHRSRPQVVHSASNLGFGGGCNLGASRSKADAVFLLNPDARLRPGTSAGLAAALEADPEAAVVAPRVLDPSGQSRAASAGAAPSLRATIGHFLLLGRLPLARRVFVPLHLAHPDRRARPDWVSGAAMLVRREAFVRAGGFDEGMFMYMEDVDLCLRLRALGWHILYEPSLTVEHRIGGSQSEDQSERWFRAYHAYVARRCGSPTARAASLAAGIGLGLRAVAYRGKRPLNAARNGRAARTALHLALLPARPDDPLQPTEGVR